MPRKTKEQKELKNDIKEPKKASTIENKSTSTKKRNLTSKNSNTTKKESTTKKTTSKNVINTKKKSTSSTKKSPTKKTAKTLENKKVEIVEYYDLPYRYNQTIVKVLAQTPTNLFIYWDISDTDRKNFEKRYGENFFETTRPILIVHNNTLNYSFEVEINDFANSWYLHVADSKCDYRIELGRRPIIKSKKLTEDYIHVYTSNEIE